MDMKKYNLSKIMKYAWELVRGFGLSISDGLRRSWAAEKYLAAKKSEKEEIERKRKISANVINENGEEKIIETKYNKRGYWKNSVLEAVATEDGGIEFKYSKSGEFKETAKTNKWVNVTFSLKAGAMDGDIFGIIWENVKYFCGKTYELKEEIKTHGFIWNAEKKHWARKEA